MTVAVQPRISPGPRDEPSPVCGSAHGPVDARAVAGCKGGVDTLVVIASQGDAALSFPSRTAHVDIIAHFSQPGVSADILFVDNPSGLSEASFIDRAATRAMRVVVTDKPRSLSAVATLTCTVFRLRLARRFHTVVNRADGAPPARDVHDSLLECIDPSLDVLVEQAGSMLEDVHTGRSVRGGRSVVQMFPRAPSAFAFTKPATRVASWPRPATPAGRIVFFVERLVQAADTTLVRAAA